LRGWDRAAAGVRELRVRPAIRVPVLRLQAGRRPERTTGTLREAEERGRMSGAHAGLTAPVAGRTGGERIAAPTGVSRRAVRGWDVPALDRKGLPDRVSA